MEGEQIMNKAPSRFFFRSAIALTLLLFSWGVAAEKLQPITAETFTCLNDMTRVRHFFVDNLLGDVEAVKEQPPTRDRRPARGGADEFRRRQHRRRQHAFADQRLRAVTP